MLVSNRCRASSSLPRAAWRIAQAKANAQKTLNVFSWLDLDRLVQVTNSKVSSFTKRRNAILLHLGFHPDIELLGVVVIHYLS
jgi:hypothetical protein